VSGSAGPGSASQVRGDVDCGFEGVADAFRDNLERQGELGAAFAAYVGERKVVDLWGGTADREAGVPWTRDTLQVVFSGSKGLTAGCLLLLIDAGRLALGDPVAEHWPEFGQAGKDAITIGELISHRAGLPAVTAPLELGDITDPVRMAKLLAGQEPRWFGGARCAYHALTFGWLCDAIVRRVSGLSIGRLFADRIAGPLGLEAWIGLPVELLPRVSRLAVDDAFGPGVPLADEAYGRLIYANPPTFAEPLPWNTDAYRMAEIPAAGGIASARAMARYYACLAKGGELGGVRIWSEEVTRLAMEPLSDGADPYDGERCHYSTGFELQKPEHMFLGPVERAFGHPGAGGSTHGAWPDAHVGFSYAMNLMRDDQDERGRRLLRALADALS
jgi:CubicO group peptidase (beta-lactamase class C family)